MPKRTPSVKFGSPTPTIPFAETLEIVSEVAENMTTAERLFAKVRQKELAKEKNMVKLPTTKPILRASLENPLEESLRGEDSSLESSSKGLSE